jgi:hypothetical protein
MRPIAIFLIAVSAAAVHRLYGSPAGWNAYLFLGIMVLVSAMYRPSWLGLTWLIEAWFIFDYAIYGTAISALGRSKMPLTSAMDLAYGHAYLIGALALMAFGCGAFLGLHWQGGIRQTQTDCPRWVFFLFTAAGIASIAVLLLDPESRRQLLFEHVGLSPREGMGRYTALWFMLPTTAIGLWYICTAKRRYSRVLTVVGLLAIASLHLGYGRRLMWAGALLMVYHLLKVRGIFTLRPVHMAAAVPVVLLVSMWMEATKNVGWFAAGERIHIAELADPNAILAMVDNSVGRFDATAALIADRAELPYYYGRTFLLAPLQVLPVAAGLPRSRGVREELGELIYGNFGKDLVSQEPSLVGELYANFGAFGVMAGFLVVGFVAAYLDVRCQQDTSPLVAIGYGLCLFRAIHQLGTAATSWVPLTMMAFLPWICTLAAAKLTRRVPA